LEKNLGIIIFKRTSKGVLPTAQGEEFLRYAKSILDQVEQIEKLYHSAGERVRFSVCVPQSSYMTYAFGLFLSQLDEALQMDIRFKQTPAGEAVRHVAERECKVAIIRCQAIHEDDFRRLLADKSIEFRTLWDFSYQVLFSQSHPLAKEPSFTREELRQYVQILYEDGTIPGPSITDSGRQEDWHAKKTIWVDERGSLLDLLRQVPGSFAWSAPVPQAVLDRYGLAQRKCDAADLRAKDLLICPEGYCLTSWEEGFIRHIERVQEEISRQGQR